MTDVAKSLERETPVHEQAADWQLAAVGLAVIMAGPARYSNERERYRYFSEKRENRGKQHGE